MAGRAVGELRPEVRAESVRILREELSEEDLEKVRIAHATDPLGWIGLEHMFWGMGVRNLLRRRGLRDDVLPSGNWDDYYIQAIEAAAGLREP